MFDPREPSTRNEVSAGQQDETTSVGAIRLVRGEQATLQTSQTVGMARRSGVDASVGATKLWMGRVTGLPRMNSGPHHHGDAETGGYVLSGHCRIYYGKDYAEFVECGPGDFVFVPAYLPHIEENVSDTEPVEFVTVRSPQNTVVNL